MISPTVGRVVWFRPNGFHPEMNHYSLGGPLDAHIVHVWNDRLVNVVVFDSAGKMHVITSCLLRQADDDVPVGTSFAEWMPYQVGQAKKDEVVTGVGSAP